MPEGDNLDLVVLETHAKLVSSTTTQRHYDTTEDTMNRTERENNQRIAKAVEAEIARELRVASERIGYELGADVHITYKTITVSFSVTPTETISFVYDAYRISPMDAAHRAAALIDRLV
jgi:hypothetical protein